MSVTHRDSTVMTSRTHLTTTLTVCALAGATCLVAAAPAAAATKSRSPFVSAFAVQRGTLTASGHLPVAARGVNILVQRRVGRRLIPLRQSRPSRRSYSLSVRVPRAWKTVTLRTVVVTRGRKSRVVATGPWRTLRVQGLPPAMRIAPVASAKIASAPAPGQAGALVVRGAVSARPGQAIALGITPATPEGLLARVTAVARSGDTTTLTVEPATLPDVIPVGSFDVTSPDPASASMSEKAAGTVPRNLIGQMGTNASCTTGEKLTAEASAGISAGIKMSASWSPWNGTKAEFTASATAEAHVNMSVSGQAECTLDAVAVFPAPIPLPSVAFSVGPIPVVITPKAQVYVWGSASAQASASAGADAAFTVSAGARYDDGRFSSSGGATPSITARPPSAQGSALVLAHVGPVVDFHINGIAGPRVDVDAGLKLAADTQANPWWKLTAPVSAGAQLRMAVWKLSVESPRFTIWSTEPQLAAAGGPFAAPAPAPAPTPAPTPTPTPTPTPAGPTSRALLTWDNDADVDLHIWDEIGNHAYFGDQEAIPSGELIEDVIPGFGPEEFRQFTGASGHTYTYGVCVFDGSYPNVTLKIIDPDGRERVLTDLMGNRKSAWLVDSSPTGVGYVPAPDWCDHSGGDPTEFGTEQFN